MSWWPLADPIACPGLFDLLAIVISRTWREAALGSIVAATNAAMLMIALLLLARLIHTITATLVVTVAITLAAAASAEFVRVLAPAPAAACVLTLAAWTAVLHQRFAMGLLAVLAATVPPFTIPLAIIAAWLAWPRGGVRSAGAVISVLAASAIVQFALGPSSGTHSLLSCLIPLGGLLPLVDARHVFSQIVTASPVASALAILGLFSLQRLARAVRHSFLPMTLVAIWGAAALPSQPAAATAPVFIVFWVLAAAGLSEVWTHAARTVGGRVGTVALSIALVILQCLSANARRDPAVPDDGHGRLTLAAMTAIVGALPRGAALVEEDAITGLLTRALPGRMRASDRVRVIRRDAGAVNEALRQGPVFALPRSQRVLQHLAFELGNAGVAVPGLAEVRRSHTCTAELGATPDAASVITGKMAFALVADDERSRDPVIVVLAAAGPVSVAPLGWPPESLRGLHGRMFDLGTPVDRSDLASELRSYELLSWPLPNGGYVTRIEAWRIPGAPLVLPIALGTPPVAAVARRTGTSANQHLRLCPSFPYDVRPLVRRP